MSTATTFSSRKSDLAAARCGKSKPIRLWPSRNAEPSAKASSLASAAAKSPFWNTKDCPVSPRTAAKRWMRPSRKPTSRSMERQRGAKPLASIESLAESIIEAIVPSPGSALAWPSRHDGAIHRGLSFWVLRSETPEGLRPRRAKVLSCVHSNQCRLNSCPFGAIRLPLDEVLA